MGIEWLPGPDWDQLHATYRLWKRILIVVPVVAGTAWLFYEMWRQV